MLNLLGGLVDTEKIIKEYIEGTIEDVSAELNIKPDQLFLMIKPIAATSHDFKVYLYDLSKGNPTMVREMKLSEFVNNE
jgi:hypothetical protein